MDAAALLGLRRSEVFLAPASTKGVRAKFYRNILPDLPVAFSPAAGRFFQLDDFELAYLTQKSCPFSRAKLTDYGPL